MTTMLVGTIVLALLGSIPGETTGWGTGAVQFIARVNTSEHQEIYPVCAGQYTVEVTIAAVGNDPAGALDNRTTLDVCYQQKMGLVAGDYVQVTGTYYDGASPLPYRGRVVASLVEDLGSWSEPVPPEEPNDLSTPSVLTGSAQATETTATLQGTLTHDGGISCRCRFVYKLYDGTSWRTDWIESVSTKSTFSQKIAGLIPGTRYFYRVEAQNLVGTDIGREGSFATLEEKVPPISHPAVWVAEPAQVDTASLTMTADIERDLTGPQEYFFDFVDSPSGGAGGSDSLWQLSPVYVDVGLNPNHQYGYRVKARDGRGNETAYAPVRYQYTDIETPEGVKIGELTTHSVRVQASSVLSGLGRGQSGLKLENITAGQVSAWQQDNAYWTSDGLLPNTQYAFRAQARNGDGDRTPFSGEARVFTLAMDPSVTGFSDVTTSRLYVHWSANGNPAGTLFWCQNTVSGANSGWTTGTQWLDTGLSPNVRYSYRVKARNGDGVETALSAAVAVYSAIEAPAGITLGTITPSTIQVRSQNAPSGLDRGESGLLFENITTGQVSPWRRDNSFWTSDMLKPNRLYGVRVRARNGDSVQTSSTETAYIYTQANTPTAAGFAAVTATCIQAQWGTNGNPAGTLYLCENTTAGMNSGWTTATAWDNTGLVPNTVYTYRVKARNADGVETAWTSLGTQSTDYRTLTISATPGGQVTAPGSGTLRYAPGASVPLTAVPRQGYHFLRWTGSAVDADRVADPNVAQTTVLVDAHYTLVANFLRTQMYVDARATGLQDGSTWPNAFKSLQDALAAAQVGNEIWVAQGVYKADKGTRVLVGDRTATFAIGSGVRVKGGFAGLGQPDPNQRDIVLYETVLSGDLKGDDKPVRNAYDLYSELSRTDNSFHVVSFRDAGRTTVLDGVVVTAGNGLEGAGMHLVRSHPALSQCTIRANRAGALSGDGLEGWGLGAGIACYRSDPVLSECVFLSNWAGSEGGGLHSLESRPTLVGCLFQDDQAGAWGGGLYCQDSNSVLLNCTFRANGAAEGGAVACDEGCDTRVTGCRFLGNAAHDSGGAVFAAGRDLSIANSIFSGNLAFVDGGAVALARGTAALTNCTFNRNVAEGKQVGQTLAVTQASAKLTNCILWGQTSDAQRQIVLTGTTDGKAELTVSRCDVTGGTSSVLRQGTTAFTWAAGNMDADPRFQDAAGADKVAGTKDDDLRLRSGSPCVDAGDNTAVPADADDLDSDGDRLERLPVDIDARPRFVDHPVTANTGIADAPRYPQIVDLGASELPAP
ncbi:MAG: hypothetical protein MUC88_15315 [Planctomycetes bacterium]|nr:hypothetical protein [Planctomycetota bacterium]